MLFRADRLRSEQQLMARIEDLDARARSAYLELSRHYWQRGRLPAEDRDLAAICKVSVVAFRHMRVQLGWAFDGLAPDGRWLDRELEAERHAAILALGRDPADFAPQAEPAALRADVAGPPEKPNRSDINRRNAFARWDKDGLKKAPLDAPAADGRGAMQSEVRFASEPMQSGMQNAGATGAKSHAVSHGLASSHPASSLDDEDDDSRKSSSSSSESPAPAGHANAKPDANSHGVASQRGGERPPPIYKDAELLDVYLVETGGNIEPRLQHVSSVKPIRDLMREGCDLELHIVPALQAVKTLRDPLRQPCPDWLRDQARARRDAPAQPPRPRTPGNLAQRFFAEVGSEQYEKWRAYKERTTKRTFDLKTKVGDREGWQFAAEWPPELPAESMAAAG